jgi:putative flippase GtrA
VVRSAGVGSLATAVDLIALTILVHGWGLAPSQASIPALVLGVGAQFVGNKLFAFRDRSKDWLQQAALFGGVELGAFALNVALYDLAVTRTSLPYLPLRLATTSLVYFAFCLPLWSLIFRPTERREGASA